MSNNITKIAAALETVPAAVRSRKIFRIVPESGNTKTGKTFQVYSARTTCPASCPFKGKNGCYAEGINCKKVWDTAEGCESLEDIALELIAASKKTAKAGSFVRHNVAGDVAISGTDNIDTELLSSLAAVYGSTGTLACTYTHCAPTEENFAAIKSALAAGFVVNQSCESVYQADKALAAGVPAVLAVPKDEKAPERTPAGHRIVVCPNQSRGLHCNQCKLCARGNRQTVVAFIAHGAASRKASIAIKNARAAYEEAL